MVINGIWNGQRLSLSDKPNCLTVSLESEQGTRVYSFDLSGRLWTALMEGVAYRRGLDGKIVAKYSLPDGSRDRKWLTRSEAASVEEEARRLSDSLAAGIFRDELDITQPPSDRMVSVLGRAGLFTPARIQEDISHYHLAYQPVGILPPDQYMAVVLQLTEGCSFNTCTFCNFYRERRFRIKPLDEFKLHIDGVKDLLADGLSLRRTIFLGDANALVTPMSRLVPLVEAVHAGFDVEAMGGLYAFLDGFSGEKKTAADYRLLADAGMKRIYLGMESGSPELLQFLKKPGQPEDVVQAVRAMKKGGIPVGIIVLLGAGGKQFAAEHVRRSVEILNALDLDADDLLYFSELVESEGLEYTQAAYDASLQPLTAEERVKQGEEIAGQLKFLPSRGIPHISRYDIREFVY